MSAVPKKVFDQTMRMPLAQRASLAASLIRSLDGETDPDAEEAWGREIARRMKDLKRGKARTIPWSKARRMIFGRTNAARS